MRSVEFPSQLELIARVALALVLGGAVGLEREVNEHPAGLRTHIAVCVGSALFGIVSAYAFTAFDVARDKTIYQVDVTRISSQVVTGIGFLGGGAILKYGPNVKGLTTAASIWVTAAIGLAVAMGSYTIASVTTVLIVLSLAGLRGPSRYIERRFRSDREIVLVHLRDDGVPSAVVSGIAELPGVSISSLMVRNDDEGTTIEVRVKGRPGGELESLVAPLADRDDVRSVEVT